MDEIIELENEKTGKIRQFPRALFDSLVSLCLGTLPPSERERAEEQVGRMVGQFIDTSPKAEALREAANALCPGLVIVDMGPPPNTPPAPDSDL